MKYLMVDAGYTFDDSTKVIKRQYSERQSINSVYMVKEDCTVLFGDQAEPANAPSNVNLSRLGINSFEYIEAD